mmetsp:Transcript_37889/g.91881  ORF Transcript_37889/g.91881 Transcript_37889/m.91881 type:complete len:455 (-) Transcript_37889:46-1410(-)
MVYSMENAAETAHVVEDDGGSGGSAPNSNSSSSQGMYGDASDETRQINAIEQVEDDAMGASNSVSNANSHPSQGNGTSEGTSEVLSVGQAEDASMGMSSEATMSISSTAPSSISSSWNGDNDELWFELGRAYRREFRGQAVVWQHVEENYIFSSAYVCPFSGECFLSGTIIETGYGGRDGEFQWYHSEDRAMEAALKRFLDCYHFRKQPPNSPADTNRHCHEEPYRAAGSLVLPSSIPQQARQRIQLYQQEALASAAPSMTSTDISPLTFSNGTPTLRPPEQETVMVPQNGTLIAPMVDRNARMVLNERYQDGIINGHRVLECSIPYANFLVYKIGSTSHQPYFTCVFVCPLFGEHFFTGGSDGNDPSTLMHGLHWFRSKKQAKAAAAARAIDCFEHREGRSNGPRFCVEEPYAPGNGPQLPALGQREFSAKIRRLQADARERLQRFRQNQFHG